MINIYSNTNDITMKTIEEASSNEYSYNLISDPVISTPNTKNTDCSFICHLSKSISSSEFTEEILSSNTLITNYKLEQKDIWEKLFYSI